MSWLFVVSDLKQWDYCPRVVYYAYTIPRLRPESFKMVMGREAHKQAHTRPRPRRLRGVQPADAERYDEVSLISEELGLSGKVDVVLRAGEEAWPVEYKLSRRLQIARHYRLQLAAYALLLEASWSVRVREGYLYSLLDDRGMKVPITPQLRKKVLHTVEEIRRMIEEERMPEATRQRARCVDCEYRRFCNDVF
ncbi:MAG: CRISPR-associated protein Cas4 [Caldilineae bacterium]|nr:MAG: CRISPR-associated protein Cas4 [Caldilineae bacterium]